MRTLLLMLALAGLVGCSGLPPVSAPAPAISSQGVALKHFEMRGRVSVRAAEQQFSGGMIWRRQAPEEVVLLATPLGQGVAELRIGPAGVVLVDADGRWHEAADAEALLATVQGWRLPIRGLGYWLIGQPDPARPHAGQRDAAGRWLWLEQDGWRIDFARHSAEGLPGRLVARRDGEIEIRLVVDAWQTF